jgi:hypothetical protein
MWLFIWFVLSAFLIGTTVWSLQILLRQKVAWEKFAKDNQFTFKRGTFMGPAEINGVKGDYKVSFFTAERSGEDMRNRRYVTTMEVNLIDGLVDGGVMGTKEMLAFMQSLDKLRPFKIEYPAWEEGMFAFMRNDAAVRAYLTPERIEIFSQLLKTKNADVLIVFNDRELVVRMETSDPMQDAEKMDKIFKRVTGLCDRLRIAEEERKSYMALAT